MAQEEGNWNATVWSWGHTNQEKKNNQVIVCFYSLWIFLDSISSSSTRTNNVVINYSYIRTSTGSLRFRLSTHWQIFSAEYKKNKSRSWLHQWYQKRDGREVMSRVMTFSICGVNICFPCFTTFHKEENITDPR